MSTTLLAPLIGPHHAAAFVATRTRALIELDLHPPAVAQRIVEEGIAASDPVILTEPGQTWSLRDDAPCDDDRIVLRLTVIRRDGAEALLEDEFGQQQTRSVRVLSRYVLTRWHWSSPPPGM